MLFMVSLLILKISMFECSIPQYQWAKLRIDPQRMDEKLEEETNEQPHKKQRATAPAEQTSSVDDYMEITLAYSSQFPLQTSIHNHLARGFSSFPRLKTPRRVVRDSTILYLLVIAEISPIVLVIFPLNSQGISHGSQVLGTGLQ